MDPGESRPRVPSGPATSRHLVLAIDGNQDSLGWIIERYDPCLHAAARHHLGTNLRAFLDPQDLVSEVWAVALRRLPELGTEGVLSPRAFLKFLATTLRNILNNAVRKHLRAGRPRPGSHPPGGDLSTTADPLDRISADVTGVTTSVRIREARDTFDQALAELEEKDREVIVLRGLEQLSNQDAAAVLGLEPGTVAVRYHRALARLKARLPQSVFAELGED